MTTASHSLTFTKCDPKPVPSVLAIEVTEENIGSLIEYINSSGAEPCLRAHDGGTSAYWVVDAASEAFEVGRVLLFNTDFKWLRVTWWDAITGRYITGETITAPNE